MQPLYSHVAGAILSLNAQVPPDLKDPKAEGTYA